MAIIRDMPSNAYHATEDVSKGDLDAFARSPAHYKAKKASETKETKALRVGRLIHTAILERWNLYRDYVIKPDIDRRTKDGKKAYTEWENEHIGQTVVSKEEYDQACAMSVAAYRHPVFGKYLEAVNAERELSVFAANTGVKCKSRFDYYHPQHGTVIDVKSTDDASPAAFYRSVMTYRYHVQHTFYLDNARNAGLYAKRFIFAAIEKNPPYPIALYELDNDTQRLGRHIYITQLARFNECIENGEWPSYPEEIQTLSSPCA